MRDGHKTCDINPLGPLPSSLPSHAQWVDTCLRRSRFYGPFAASLPQALTPILDEYCNVLELTAPTDGGPYLVRACTTNAVKKRAPNGSLVSARSSTRRSRSPTDRSSPRRGAGGSSVFLSATTAKRSRPRRCVRCVYGGGRSDLRCVLLVLGPSALWMRSCAGLHHLAARLDVGARRAQERGACDEAQRAATGEHRL